MNNNNNTFTNEFGDRVCYIKSYQDFITNCKSYIIVIENKYIKTVGSLIIAKGVINKYRGKKCKWISTFE